MNTMHVLMYLTGFVIDTFCITIFGRPMNIFKLEFGCQSFRKNHRQYHSIMSKNFRNYRYDELDHFLAKLCVPQQLLSMYLVKTAKAILENS